MAPGSCCGDPGDNRNSKAGVCRAGLGDKLMPEPRTATRNLAATVRAVGFVGNSEPGGFGVSRLGSVGSGGHAEARLHLGDWRWGRLS